MAAIEPGGRRHARGADRVHRQLARGGEEGGEVSVRHPDQIGRDGSDGAGGLGGSGCEPIAALQLSLRTGRMRQSGRVPGPAIVYTAATSWSVRPSAGRSV